MYSESDLDAAVQAGAISADAAAALRNFVAKDRALPAVDEEQFRLLSGFNDIFVAIALVLTLGAVAWLGSSITSAVGGRAVAAAAWLCAEYFTKVRRMALPSILLMFAFVGGVGGAVFGILQLGIPFPSPVMQSTMLAVAAGAGAIAAWAHWQRFMVPITIAAGVAAVVGFVLALGSTTPALKGALFPAMLLAGLVVFGLAMWWDMSDRERRTRRSDVAFWLHMAAAPLIAHPVFQMIGAFNADVDGAKAGIVLLLYLIFAVIALAVDRRALLVSSLVYVLYAMGSLIKSAVTVELSAAVTALAIGSALLVLSALWHRMRQWVVGLLGNSLRDRLPPVQMVVGV